MSPPAHPITIIGGGLAGLTLGIALRKHDLPVTIYEAGTYPRHRVCGEFISGGGVGVLAQLGLRSQVMTAGAREARTVVFCTPRRAYPAKQLPRPACCISRYVLDELLAREFRALGGSLHERERVVGSEYGAGVVRATGRRAETQRRRQRWLGLKAHAHGVELSADLEMHFLQHGYVGLCRLENGHTNVCGLFALDEPIASLAQHWPEVLRGPTDSILFHHLEHAAFDRETFCAVSGISLRPGSAAANDDVRIGDALTMIPPVTGNGMSMALESAVWAAEPLTRYSRGTCSWAEARAAIARRCDEGFARRLLWAAWLQWAIMRHGRRDWLLSLTMRADWLWRSLFDRTR